MNNFWCKDHLDENCVHKECNLCDSKGMVQSNNEEVVCPIAANILKLMGQVTYGKVGVRMNSKQIHNDRKKRSSNHFAKEILPNLPKSDQRDFARLGKKKK